jgi:hypothetical protein
MGKVRGQTIKNHPKVALFRLHYPKLNNIKYAGDLDFNFDINT